MKPTKTQFLAQERKAITFIGMSGVGKSFISAQLAEWGWMNYSCDYLIGTTYLGHLITGDGEMSTTNISSLSDFVGQLGDPSRGGLSFAEFETRQALYYKAECDVLRDMPDAVEAAKGHFVCDSSGSLCEVEDERVLAKIGQRSVLVYLQVHQAGQAEILKRALESPKPLYFPPAFLHERLARYMAKFGLNEVEEIDPIEFLRWIFPHLFEARLPKYSALAKEYGVVLPSHNVDLSSEGAFIAQVAEALDG